MTQPLSGPELYAEIVAYLEAAGWEASREDWWMRGQHRGYRTVDALRRQLAADGVGRGAHAGQETRP